MSTGKMLPVGRACESPLQPAPVSVCPGGDHCRGSVALPQPSRSRPGVRALAALPVAQRRVPTAGRDQSRLAWPGTFRNSSQQMEIILKQIDVVFLSNLLGA